MKKVAIIYLLWADEPKKYLKRALEGAVSQSYDKSELEFVIVYNPSETLTQLDFIKDLADNYKEDLPQIKVLGQKDNIGFSAGNNAGMRYAVDNGADYIFLHNGDGYLHEKAIENMVKKMSSDVKIGQAQAMMLLSDQINKINSSGNSWHYLSIGYCRECKKCLVDFKEKNREIGYASGAATILRADLLKKHGFWKEDFFLYHEDTDYSLRLRTLGYKIVLATDAYFYHDYEFDKNKKKFYWIERNRHAIKLMYYKWPTWFLLLPIDILYNIGLLFYALIGGWLGELLQVYVYWLNPRNWQVWLKYRAEIQKNRVVNDRFLLKKADIKVNATQIKNPIILKPINLVFTIYGFLLKMLVWW